MFAVVERRPGEDFWEAVISDAIVGDRPRFRYHPPGKSKHPPFTAQELAVAAAEECNEATGLVTLTHYREGLPVFCGAWASNGRNAFCVLSTDAAAAKPVDPGGLRERAMKAIREAQGKRQLASGAA
jgi:hypothetical protein